MNLWEKKIMKAVPSFSCPPYKNDIDCLKQGHLPCSKGLHETDIDGNYLLAQMTQGKYHFQISLPGYVTINVIIEIIFPTTVIQNFPMTLVA
jgi:hypothetical protein